MDTFNSHLMDIIYGPVRPRDTVDIRAAHLMPSTCTPRAWNNANRLLSDFDCTAPILRDAWMGSSDRGIPSSITPCPAPSVTPLYANAHVDNEAARRDAHRPPVAMPMTNSHRNYTGRVVNIRPTPYSRSSVTRDRPDVTPERVRRPVPRGNPSHRPTANTTATVVSDDHAYPTPMRVSDEQLRRYINRVQVWDPRYFEGKEWYEYRVHFEACKSANNWNDEEALLVLRTKLTGDAAWVAQQQVRSDAGYQDVLYALDVHFGHKQSRHLVLAQLNQIKQQPGERAQDFAIRLYKAGVGRFDSKLEENYQLLEAFTYNLREAKHMKAVKTRRPPVRTIQAALAVVREKEETAECLRILQAAVQAPVTCDLQAETTTAVSVVPVASPMTSQSPPIVIEEEASQTQACRYCGFHGHMRDQCSLKEHNTAGRLLQILEKGDPSPLVAPTSRPSCSIKSTSPRATDARGMAGDTTASRTE